MSFRTQSGEKYGAGMRWTGQDFDMEYFIYENENIFWYDHTIFE